MCCFLVKLLVIRSSGAAADTLLETETERALVIDEIRKLTKILAVVIATTMVILGFIEY